MANAGKAAKGSIWLVSAGAAVFSVTQLVVAQDASPPTSTSLPVVGAAPTSDQRPSITSGPAAPVEHPKVAAAPATTATNTASSVLAAQDDEDNEEEHSAAADFARGEAVDMGHFLDRLMLAESGGRDSAKNPRSTATGPFQFIESTFLVVVRRHFHDETAALTDAELLTRRTDRNLARRAAEAYTRENAAVLESAGIVPTFANLRLAFLLGPQGASRVLKSTPDTKVSTVLSSKAIAANPFMKAMTSADLVRKASREVALRPGGTRLAQAVVAALHSNDESAVGSDASGGTPPLPNRPRIVVRCRIALASCRAWVAKVESKLTRNAPRQARR